MSTYHDDVAGEHENDHTAALELLDIAVDGAEEEQGHHGDLNADEGKSGRTI